MKLVQFIQVAGLLHFGLLWAGATMPRAVGLRQHLAPLPPFVRRLFYVYFGFIGLCLASFGMLSLVFARELAAREPLARALCVFFALFWIVRSLAAALVFDVRPYLVNWFYRVGYQLTNAVFLYLVLVYAFAAWKGN